MFFSFLFSLLIFGSVTLGLAWPLANRLALDSAEKLTTTVALSVLGVFLFAWLIFVCALPLSLLWFLPALAITSLLIERRKILDALRDQDALHLVLSQSLITLWSIGWLALILSYSGGDWMMDWFEHMERTWYFLAGC